MDPRDSETYDIPELESMLLHSVFGLEAASLTPHGMFINPNILGAAMSHIHCARQNMRERNAA